MFAVLPILASAFDAIGTKKSHMYMDETSFDSPTPESEDHLTFFCI